MIGRGIYLLACTLVLAGITHIVIVLLIPTFGTKDAFAELSRQTKLLNFTTLDSTKPDSPLTDIDPFFTYGVCRFNLEETGVRMVGDRIDTFWSATVVDGNGTELILLNPIQILRLRELQPPDVENAIVVESEVEDGFVVLRVLSPDASWKLKTANYLANVICESYVPTMPPPEEAEPPAS